MDFAADALYLVAVQPVYNVLLVCYWLTFSTGLGFALILLALLVETAKIPLSLRLDIQRWQMVPVDAMRRKLRAHFRDDEEAYQKHMRAVFVESGSNPLWSVGPMLLTIISWIVLIPVIGLFSAAEGSAHAYPLLSGYLADSQINTKLLWMDLTGSDRIVMPVIILAVAAAVQFVWRIPSPRPQTLRGRIADDWSMPVIFAVVMALAPSGLAVYVVASCLVGVIQYRLVIRRVNGTPPAFRPVPDILAGNLSAN